MRKFLFDSAFEQINVVGFDLDGTIYDEFDFIVQVYQEIIRRTNVSLEQYDEIYEFMINRWLEKGSSYPFIFKEAKERFLLDDRFEDNALTIFRNFEPDLGLPKRMKYYLEKIKHNGKKLFLLSDGRKKLQFAKIKSLGIEEFFDLIIITEDRPKPDPIYRENIIQFFQSDQKKIVYIGDREIDQEFALNCGFLFYKVSFISL